ncbi:ankyrin repeat-containing domain protein [Morchella snyderi]|nr:ankyrin repeat-containing domain protein [Morchella snyderi]
MRHWHVKYLPYGRPDNVTGRSNTCRTAALSAPLAGQILTVRRSVSVTGRSNTRRMPGIAASLATQHPPYGGSPSGVSTRSPGSRTAGLSASLAGKIAVVRHVSVTGRSNTWLLSASLAGRIPAVRQLCQRDWQVKYLPYGATDKQVVQKTIKVLSTIIKQLARQKKTLPKALKQFYKQYHREASFATEGKLEAQLADLFTKFDQVFLIVDAMDEFDRREKDIEKTFTSCNLPTIQIEANKVDADIETFIQFQLKERSRDVVMDQTLKDKIAQSLISKSSGMFLWVRYQLDYIYEQPSVGHTYKKIDKQVAARRTIAQRALIWVVNAGRPLKLSELALAVSIEPDSTSHEGLEEYGQQLVLDTCGNLLAENDGIVRPVHYTVQEFLTASDEDRVDTGNPILCQFQSIIRHKHLELAQICLQYLLFQEIRNCYYAAPRGDYDSRYPFGLYAASYWDYHVQRLPGPTIPGALVRSIDKLLDSEGSTLETAYYMRNSDYRGPMVVSALNYCLAFNLLHLYGLSHRLDASAARALDALHHAAASGSTASIEILLGMGSSVHARDEDGSCPLHYAASAGHTAAAELLLDRGADIDAENKNHDTALAFGAAGGHEILVRVLLERGAAVNLADRTNRGFVLANAASGGNQCVVQMLIDRGADINLTGGDWDTALVAASCRRHQSIVQLLLDNGADVNLTGGASGTALAAAAKSWNESVVQLLLDSGADVNITGGKRGTALAVAAANGYQFRGQMLLNRGADVNITCGKQGTALAAAAANGHQMILQMLLNSGADVNITCGKQGTALAAAARIGPQNIVRMLLNRGANVNLTGGEWGTALAAAARIGHQNIVQMLLDRGADVNLTGGE